MRSVICRPASRAARALLDPHHDQVVILRWSESRPERLEIGLAGKSAKHVAGAKRFAKKIGDYLKPVLKKSEQPGHD